MTKDDVNALVETFGQSIYRAGDQELKGVANE